MFYGISWLDISHMGNIKYVWPCRIIHWSDVLFKIVGALNNELCVRAWESVCARACFSQEECHSFVLATKFQVKKPAYWTFVFCWWLFFFYYCCFVLCFLSPWFRIRFINTNGPGYNRSTAWVTSNTELKPLVQCSSGEQKLIRQRTTMFRFFFFLFPINGKKPAAGVSGLSACECLCVRLHEAGSLSDARRCFATTL